MIFRQLALANRRIRHHHHALTHSRLPSTNQPKQPPRFVTGTITMLPTRATIPASPADPVATGHYNVPDVNTMREAILSKLTYAVGKNAIAATERDWFVATALAVRDQITERWINSIHKVYVEKRKRVYYLSLEFLVGRFLFDAMMNIGITDIVRDALAELNVDLASLRAVEPDAALGNGGLGRLAACFMESGATLGVPLYGYGIRYDHGLFRQRIKDGWQLEYPEDWLSFGNPWEFERAEVSYSVGFGGSVESVPRTFGTAKLVWQPAEMVQAVAYDTPIAGWRGHHVNSQIGRASCRERVFKDV